MGIYQLKERGHDLIDELEALGMKLNGHRGVYSRLRRMLKVPEEKAHFSNMFTEWELVAAVGALESMLIQKKMQTHKHLRPDDIIPNDIRTKLYLPDVYLPHDKMKEALAELSNTKVVIGPDQVWIVKLT